jgi:hypothetical protein
MRVKILTAVTVFWDVPYQAEFTLISPGVINLLNVREISGSKSYSITLYSD